MQDVIIILTSPNGEVKGDFVRRIKLSGYIILIQSVYQFIKINIDASPHVLFIHMDGIAIEFLLKTGMQQKVIVYWS